MSGNHIIVIGYDITETEIKQHKLENIISTRNEFMGHVSHEIRTPLNGINASIEMINYHYGNKIPNEIRKHLTTLNDCSINLMTIINDLLDLSRIEAGKLNLIKQPFMMDRCVGSAVALVESMINEKNLDFSLEIDDDIHRAFIGDSGRIRQVLSNILSNAAKFTSAGSIELSITNEGEDTIRLENGISTKLLTTKFQVKDTGIGIPEDKLGSLFDPFVQLDAGLTKKYTGIGLGLSICRYLVELMEGSICATSVMDEGSIFSFKIRLPVYNSTNTLDPSKIPELKDKKILVVDDNKLSLNFVASTLAKYKSIVLKCDDPIDARDLYLINRIPFDLIILDICLPDIDGFEMSCLIREEYGYKCPVIGISSIDPNQFSSKHYFEKIFIKPFPGFDLVSTVRDYIENGVPQTSILDSDHDSDSSSVEEQPRLNTPDRLGNMHYDFPISPDYTKILEPGIYSISDFKVLLVEDNEININVTIDQLETMGIKQVDVESDGFSGLEQSKEKNYHIILMDIAMPKMDGIECTKKILEYHNENRSNIFCPYIVGFTANIIQENLERAKQAGMSDILIKPVTLNKMGSTMNLVYNKLIKFQKK